MGPLKRVGVLISSVAPRLWVVANMLRAKVETSDEANLAERKKGLEVRTLRKRSASDSSIPPSALPPPKKQHAGTGEARILLTTRGDRLAGASVRPKEEARALRRQDKYPKPELRALDGGSSVLELGSVGKRRGGT